jgi:tight adherence protein B
MTPQVAGLLLGAGIGLLALLVLLPRTRRVRLADVMRDQDVDRTSAAVSPVSRFGAALLRRTAGGEVKLERFLLGAGIRTPASDVATLVVVTSVLALLIGTASSGPVAGIALSGMLVALGYFLVSRRRSKRAADFAEQLPTTLQTLVASLRAGYSLPQALESVVQTGYTPTSEEFDRMLSEVRVGRPLAQALRNLGERMASPDFDWVVIALEINEEVGGNLSEVLETVERTIRERESLRRNVRALSAEGRVSAAIIFLLPFITLGVIALGNPGYVRIFYTERVGVIMAAIAAGLMVIGGLWLKSMIKIKL